MNLRLLDLSASVELWIQFDLEGQLQCLPPSFAWGTIGGAAMSSIIFNALRRAGAAAADGKRFKAQNGLNMIKQLQGDGSYHLLNLFTSILGIQAPGHDKR